MKTYALSALALIALSAPALAEGSMSVVDTNADGVVSPQELTVVVEDLTPEAFNALDTDADGVLNAEEFAAAMEGMAKPKG